MRNFNIFEAGNLDHEQRLYVVEHNHWQNGWYAFFRGCLTFKMNRHRREGRTLDIFLKDVYEKFQHF